MSPPPQRPRPGRSSPSLYQERIRVSDAPLVDIDPDELALRRRPDRRRTVFTSGPRLLIIGFGLIIAVGALLLKLPWSAAPDQHVTWSEAIFTATSATTVTGLTVSSTAVEYSFLGQVIILILLQVGGVGFIAFSVLLFRLVGRRITLQTRFIVQQSLGTDELSGVLNLALYVLGITLALEAVGALGLWLRWRTTMSDGLAAWYAVFHAISAYCNAGFDLFSGTDQKVLFGYGTDWWSLTVMGMLITLGGFGVTIVYDLWTSRRSREWALNTRLTMVLSLALTGFGTLAVLIDPNFHAVIYPHASAGEKFFAGLFTVVSARTAGVTILPLPQLSEATQMVLMLWMFIGGAPASMAGGVSTSTVAVLFAAVLATARGRSSTVAFNKTIPHETIAKAVAIMTVSTLLVALVTLTISLHQRAPVFVSGFEVVSAFSNTGYSLDFTGGLTDFGRYLVAFTMFWGRLGPLTIVVALAQSELPTLVRYPEEPVILG